MVCLLWTLTFLFRMCDIRRIASVAHEYAKQQFVISKAHFCGNEDSRDQIESSQNIRYGSKQRQKAKRKKTHKSQAWSHQRLKFYYHIHKSYGTEEKIRFGLDEKFFKKEVVYFS